jgi:hypothetical protein
MTAEMKGSEPAKGMQLELKYCEGCGKLKLRPTGGGQIYCSRCASALEEFAIPTRRARPARIPGAKWGAAARKSNGREEVPMNNGDVTGGIS